MAKQGFDACVASIIDRFDIKEGDALKISKEIDDLLDSGFEFDDIRKRYGFPSKDNPTIIQRVKAKVHQAAVANKLFLAIIKDTDINDLPAKLSAFLVGSKNTRDAVALLQNGLVKTTMGQLMKSFGGVRKGLIAKKIRERGFQENVVREIHNFSDVSKTGDELAHNFAREINEVNKKIIRELRAYGVPIEFLEDRIAAQVHDPYLMLKSTLKDISAEDEWMITVKRLADHSRNQGKTLDDGYLRKVYALLTSKEKSKGVFEDMGDLMGLKRQIHFKDADAWMEYSSRYSHKNHIAAMLNGIEAQLNHTVLIQKMGTNPKETFEVLMDSIRKQLKKSPPPGLKQKLENMILKPENAWAQVSGEAFQNVGPSRAAFANMVSSLNAMAVLGKATLASFTDMATASAIIQSQFKGTFFHAYNRMFRNLFSKVPPEMRDDVFRSLGVGVDGILGASTMRFAVDNPLPGGINRMMQQFFILNGLDAWTDYTREGMSAVLSHNFAKKLKISYDKLDAPFKKNLDRYAITEKDWLLFQEAGSFRLSSLPDHGHLKGRSLADEEWFTPDWVTTQTGRSQDHEAVRRLQNLFVNETRLGVPEPGSAERAIMFRDYKRGSWEHMSLSLLLQFQGYPLTLTRQVLPRMLEAGFPVAMAHMMPGVMLAYVGLMAKDVTAGREPRSPVQLLTWVESFKSSGMLGLPGDAILGQFTNEAGRMDESMLGPNYGHIKDWSKVALAAANDEDWAWEAFGAVKQLVPGANLFYAEWAYNHLLFWNGKEYMRPGYLQNHERWLKKERGQEYLPSPPFFFSPEAHPRGGFL